MIARYRLAKPLFPRGRASFQKSRTQGFFRYYRMLITNLVSRLSLFFCKILKLFRRLLLSLHWHTDQILHSN